MSAAACNRRGPQQDAVLLGRTACPLVQWPQRKQQSVGLFAVVAAIRTRGQRPWSFSSARPAAAFCGKAAQTANVKNASHGVNGKTTRIRHLPGVFLNCNSKVSGTIDPARHRDLDTIGFHKAFAVAVDPRRFAVQESVVIRDKLLILPLTFLRSSASSAAQAG